MENSDKLQLIQQLSGLTQNELAQKLDVSFPTLNSWINGRSKPRKNHVLTIDSFYRKYTGQKIVPASKKEAKRELIVQKSRRKNLINFIKSRKDLYDQLVLSFTYNTNSIEGSTLTENETADIIFEGLTIRNKGLVEHLEAKNHQRALDYLFGVISSNYKITEAFVLKLHEILMTGIRDDAGMYRSHGVRIVGSNVPTSNHLSVPKHMKELIATINNSQSDSIVHVSSIHARFEQIHPFSDGNGRVGRLIMMAMLLRVNFAPAIIKKEKKREYYKYLRKAQLEGDLSMLEDFLCDAILNGFDVFGL